MSTNHATRNAADRSKAPIIRPMQKKDIPAVVQIALAAWKPIFASYRQTLGAALFRRMFGANWRVYKAVQVEQRARAEPGDFLVAEIAGRVVGFASWLFDRPTRMVQVMNNAVHPKWQRRGIASALYRELFAIARREGMQFAWVETGGDAAHTPAVQSYQKAGFTVREDVIKLYRKL